jgi:hypothetical protein
MKGGAQLFPVGPASCPTWQEVARMATPSQQNAVQARQAALRLATEQYLLRSLLSTFTQEDQSRWAFYFQRSHQKISVCVMPGARKNPTPEGPAFSTQGCYRIHCSLVCFVPLFLSHPVYFPLAQKIKFPIFPSIQNEFLSPKSHCSAIEE